MKSIKLIFTISICLFSFFLTGCRRNSNTVWEDTRSAGRHMNRGLQTLGGKHGDSRAVQSRDEFMCGDSGYDPSANNNYQASEFVPLSDDPNCDQVAMADIMSQPPRETPGDPGSSIPGIDAFQDPSTNPKLSGIFRHIHFAYNSNLIKGDENLGIVRDVANYMRKSPNTYIFVEGHCDERGPESYNLALGSNRANSVRNMLIKEGVNPDNIFTISYGKERPLVLGHEEESWAQNRRAEFKVYER